MLHSDTGSSAGLPFPNPAVTCLSTTTPAKCHREREAEPSPGSGACPRCALAVGRAGRDWGGRDPCPAGTRKDVGYQGRGLPLCRRGPSPPESLLCPGAAAVPAASAPVSCLGEGSAGWRRRRRWEGSGVSPAHFRPRFPGSLLLGFAPRSRRQGAAGEDAPGPGAARPSAPLWLRPRQGCRSRPCLGAPSPFARAAATGCLWPEGASRYFDRELSSSYGRKIASQKQPWGIEVLVQPHSKAVSRALEGQSAFCFLSGKSRFRPSLQVGHSPGFAPSHHSVPRAMLGGCPSTRMRGKGRLGAPLLVPLQGGRAGGP